MKDKTPGQVAWEAYRSALIRTPADFRGLGEAYSSPAWEAAARAVREQALNENKRAEDLLSAHVIRDIRVIQDIRRVLAQWRDAHEDPGYYDCDAVNSICKILGELTIDEARALAHERHRADPEE